MKAISKLVPRSFRFTFLAIGLSVFLSACGSASLLTASSWPGISADSSSVYVAFNQTVFALDPQNGNQLWQFPPTPERAKTFFAPPAPSEGELVVVGGYDNVINGLKPQGNRVESVWDFQDPEDRIIGAPVVVDEVVLVPSADHRLYALNINSGLPEWSQPFEAGKALWSSPLVVGDTVFLASLDHHLYAIDLDTGRERWSRDLGAAIVDTPTLWEDLLVLGTLGGEVYVVNTTSGRDKFPPLDKVESVEIQSVWGNPVVDQGIATFGDVSGKVFALDLSNGRVIWSTTLEGAIAASPVLVDGVAYFVTKEGTMHAFEIESGNTFWSTSAILGGELLSDPVVVSGDILVGSLGAECLVFSVSAETGANRCFFRLEN